MGYMQQKRLVTETLFNMYSLHIIELIKIHLIVLADLVYPEENKVSIISI